LKIKAKNFKVFKDYILKNIYLKSEFSAEVI